MLSDWVKEKQEKEKKEKIKNLVTVTLSSLDFQNH